MKKQKYGVMLRYVKWRDLQRKIPLIARSIIAIAVSITTALAYTRFGGGRQRFLQRENMMKWSSGENISHGLVVKVSDQSCNRESASGLESQRAPDCFFCCAKAKEHS